MTETSVLHGSNPFDVDPELDLLHPVQRDTPHWSETHFFHVWSPEEGVGLFLHTGRWPGDLDLWWAQTIALLPDGELLVDRSWGRAVDNRGPSTGNLHLTCEEPLSRWKIRFDGAGEVTDVRRMSEEGPSGAGPACAFQADIDLTAAAPVWDMGAALGAPKAQIDDLSWASTHFTQGFTAKGELRAGDRSWKIDGTGIRDHSSGPRDVSELGGLGFWVVVFPEAGRVVNGLVNWKPDGQVDHRVATVFENDSTTTVFDARCTGLESPVTHSPHEITIEMASVEGGVDTYEAERIHGYSLTFLEPNENLNGIDLRSQPDGLIITQSTVRVVAPDGAVGYGVVERDSRPSLLPHADPR